MPRLFYLITTFILFLSIPHTVFARFDYSNPSYETVVTRAQIAAFTGQNVNDVIVRTLASDDNGLLYTFTGDPFFDGFVIDPLAQLISIDVSGASPVFTTIATHAQIAAQNESTGVNISGMDVDSSGTVYIHEFSFPPQGPDDTMRIVPGTPPTITSLRSVLGSGGIRLDNSEQNIVLIQSIGSPFHSLANNIITFPVTGGAETVVANEAAILAETGNPALGVCLYHGPPQLPNGDFVVYDNPNCASPGSGSLLGINQNTGAVRTILTNTQIGDGVGTNINTVDMDDTQTIFMWDTFSGFRLIIFELAGAGPRHELTRSEINAGLGANFDISDFSNAFTTVSSPSEMALYATDFGEWNIIKISFPAGAPSIPTVSQWSLICLSLLLLTAGTLLITRLQPVWSLAGAPNNDKARYIKLDQNVFIPTLAAVFALGFVAYIIAFLFGYVIDGVDICGALINLPLLAYLLHLWILIQRSDN